MSEESLGIYYLRLLPCPSQQKVVYILLEHVALSYMEAKICQLKKRMYSE